MLFPRSNAWTRRQRWLIAGGVMSGLVVFAALVYSYERYYRGPKDTVLVGTWKGEYLNTLGDPRQAYRLNPDHTYEELFDYGRDESWLWVGRWHAGGDFIYLRENVDEGGDPFSVLHAWHIDSLTPVELQIHQGMSTLALKRVE